MKAVHATLDLARKVIDLLLPGARIETTSPTGSRTSASSTPHSSTLASSKSTGKHPPPSIPALHFDPAWSEDLQAPALSAVDKSAWEPYELGSRSLPAAQHHPIYHELPGLRRASDGQVHPSARRQCFSRAAVHLAARHWNARHTAWKASLALCEVAAADRKVRRVRALRDVSPTVTGELAFRQGDVIAVLESDHEDWWMGSLLGIFGSFPVRDTEKLLD